MTLKVIVIVKTWNRMNGRTIKAIYKVSSLRGMSKNQRGKIPTIDHHRRHSFFTFSSFPNEIEIDRRALIAWLIKTHVKFSFNFSVLFPFIKSNRKYFRCKLFSSSSFCLTFAFVVEVAKLLFCVHVTEAVVPQVTRNLTSKILMKMFSQSQQRARLFLFIKKNIKFKRSQGDNKTIKMAMNQQKRCQNESENWAGMAVRTITRNKN